MSLRPLAGALALETDLEAKAAPGAALCAKMIVNSNVRRVYYRTAYRDPAGIEVLRQGGVEACLYDRWRKLWR